MIQLFCLNIMNYFKIIFFYFFNIIFIYPQDTTSILTNLDIQIEATAAINKMYDFKFDEVDKEFNWLVQEYKDHPLPIFLKGLSIWWKIDAYSGLSDTKENKEIERLDNSFLELMDKSISLSKKVYDSGNKIDGAFFQAAAYGFKGRLLSERKKWRAAAFAGLNALKYLKEIREDDIMIPEISFGNGLFNYYSIWISDRYPLLKPIIKLFPKGDKKLGIKQLNDAAQNSFYTRTEAQLFLVRIFSGENNISRATFLSKYLFETFPDNSIFHRYYTQLLYRGSNFYLCKKESFKIIENFRNQKFGYYDNDMRLAHFYLGEIFLSEKKNDDAIFHLKSSLKYAQSFRNNKMGYTIYSKFLLGKIYYNNGDEISSKKYFKSVIRTSKRKSDLNSRSREYLKRL